MVRTRIVSLLTVSMLLTLAPAFAQDADGDGLSDAIEDQLGTDPQFSDNLQLIHEDGVESEAARQKAGYDPTKDIVKVEFCHVAEDR